MVTTTRWPPQANAFTSSVSTTRTTYRLAGSPLASAISVQIGSITAASVGVGRRAPRIGVSTNTWNGRTNINSPTARKATANIQ